MTASRPKKLDLTCNQLKPCIHHVQYFKADGGKSPDMVGRALSAKPTSTQTQIGSLINIFASSGNEQNVKFDTFTPSESKRN